MNCFHRGLQVERMIWYQSVVGKKDKNRQSCRLAKSDPGDKPRTGLGRALEGYAINECSQLSIKDKRQNFVLRSASSLGFQQMALPLKENKVKKKDNRFQCVGTGREMKRGS